MPRRGAGSRADLNQQDIVRALEGVGATVQSLTAVGHGCPDLLVGFRNQNFLLEVKNTSKLREKQRVWLDGWRGHAVIVFSPEDALGAIGAI